MSKHIKVVVVVLLLIVVVFDDDDVVVVFVHPSNQRLMFAQNRFSNGWDIPVIFVLVLVVDDAVVVDDPKNLPL